VGPGATRIAFSMKVLALAESGCQISNLPQMSLACVVGIDTELALGSGLHQRIAQSDVNRTHSERTGNHVSVGIPSGVPQEWRNDEHSRKQWCITDDRHHQDQRPPQNHSRNVSKYRWAPRTLCLPAS